LDEILEDLGYVLLKKGMREKKINVGTLRGSSAPNFDSVGERDGFIVNLELIKPSKRSLGGHATGSQNEKMGRMDKFYQLCVDYKAKKGLLVFIEFKRKNDYHKALEACPRRLSEVKKFKSALPGGNDVFNLIDAEIIPIPYEENKLRLKKKVLTILSKHSFP
jgi:hypothetical protein